MEEDFSPRQRRSVDGWAEWRLEHGQIVFITQSSKNIIAHQVVGEGGQEEQEERGEIVGANEAIHQSQTETSLLGFSVTVCRRRRRHDLRSTEARIRRLYSLAEITF